MFLRGMDGLVFMVFLFSLSFCLRQARSIHTVPRSTITALDVKQEQVEFHYFH